MTIIGKLSYWIFFVDKKGRHLIITWEVKYLHCRIVLERPEYGYATYCFEIVHSLPIDWQIKRLVTTMKLTSCSRTTLIEDRPLVVRDLELHSFISLFARYSEFLYFMPASFVLVSLYFFGGKNDFSVCFYVCLSKEILDSCIVKWVVVKPH